MRIYIAGPMTGIPEYNFPAFHEAARRWRAAGWEVVNPAESFGGDTTRTYREYAEHDVELLQSVQAIAMLPNWDAGNSGAIWEHAIASKLLGLQVYDAMHPVAPPKEMPQSIAEFVDAAIPPITRNAQGVLGRWW